MGTPYGTINGSTDMYDQAYQNIFCGLLSQ